MDLEKSIQKIILKDKQSNQIQHFLQLLHQQNFEFNSMETFLNNLDFHHSEIQKEDSLSFVRKLFEKSNDIIIVEESNVGSLFYFPKCTISDSCKGFVKKIQNSREDFVMEMMDLYLLLLDMERKTLETSMLIYNDCMYISHHLFMLSFKYFEFEIDKLVIQRKFIWIISNYLNNLGNLFTPMRLRRTSLNLLKCSQIAFLVLKMFCRIIKRLN
jgi:hypothetical protein